MSEIKRYMENIDFKEYQKMHYILSGIKKYCKDKCLNEIKYQSKIRRNILMHEDYPTSYYYSEERYLNYINILEKIKSLEKEYKKRYVDDKENINIDISNIYDNGLGYITTPHGVVINIRKDK